MRQVLVEAMSDLQVIESALQKSARRRRVARALRGLWQGLLVGAMLSLLLLGLWRLLPLPLWTLPLATLVPFLSALAGLVIAGWRKAPLADIARWVDGRQRLQERLTTALELAAAPEAGPWRDLVVADAAEHAKHLDPRLLVPFHLPQTTRWALLVLALGAGLGFVPEYRSKSYLQKQADQQNIREAGRQLTELTHRTLRQHPPALEPTRKALEAAAEQGDTLASKTLTRSEALRDLASVAEQLKQELKQLAQDPALRKMRELARASGGTDSQTPAGLQKQIEALQKQIGAPVGNPDALDKLANDLQRLQETAQNMADGKSPGSETERQKLSEALSALSKQMKDAGLRLPQLDDALKALAGNQPGLALKNLAAAVTSLDKLRAMARQLQQLQAQSQQMGRNLAEQLQSGQPEAAKATLQEMSTQLKSANLAPEQLQKILQEVSKAIDPADNYGKVADHLKEAARQMKAGEKPGAAQSLQAAASELENLMQQLGDAEALLAGLDNLNQASMCIGAGQRWASAAANRPGPDPFGSGTDRGAGAWADPGGQSDGKWSDHGNNTGFGWSDQDARSATGRSEGGSAHALKPANIKGQLSPGGPMPSITLQGISIKGQSKVAYEEAAAAAQSDARSALSQDKVPRAYQGAVRDYFDDLKR